MPRSVVIAGTLSVLLIAGPLRAGAIAGRVSLSVHAGTQSEFAGDMMKAGSGTLFGKPTQVKAERYRDVYRPKLRLQAAIGYGVSQRLELVARGSQYRSGKRYLTPDGGVAAGSFNGADMAAFFTGYEEKSLELALRYYIAPQARLKSFIAPVAGLRSVEEVLLSLSMPAAGTAVLNMPFSQKGTVPVYGVDLGFGFDLTENVWIGVDSGFRYQGAAKASGTYPSLGPIDAGDGRWTAPVVAMVGVRF